MRHHIDLTPGHIEITTPSTSRMLDHALGGFHHLEVDREIWDRIEDTLPGVTQAAHASRAFLRRAVVLLIAEAGITQFLDIGAGLPTCGSVYEIATWACPTARVASADLDPIVIEQTRSMQAHDRRTTMIEADLRCPAEIIYHPDVLDLLDFGEPVAVLTAGVLHYLPDTDEVAAIIQTLAELAMTVVIGPTRTA